MKSFTLLFLALTALFSLSNEEPTCSPEKIENCKVTDKNSDGCSICEDKYFPFFNNFLCLPCDHRFFGQVGCEGKCDATKYDVYGLPLCEIGGCKSGYFNLNGICFPCNEEMLGCSKCSFEVQEDQTISNYTCFECENNRYNLTGGKCEFCLMDHCIKCHYNDDYTKKICEQCWPGFYLSNGECKICRHVKIEGGYCLVCSDNDSDIKPYYCWCESGYSKTNDNNSDQICVKIPDHIYSGGGVFLSCPPNCRVCEIIDGVMKCIICVDKYALNPIDNNCDSCEKMNPGCVQCEYKGTNPPTLNCLRCENFYYSYTEIKDKIFRCFSNINREEIYYYGCLRAKKDMDRAYCLWCTIGFFLLNDKTCRSLDDMGLSYSCLGFENLRTPENPIYSCKKCKRDSAIITIDSNGKKDCFERENQLSFCLEGTIEEEENEENEERKEKEEKVEEEREEKEKNQEKEKTGENEKRIEKQKYICKRCVKHSTLNNRICKCDSDSFSKDSKSCYKCDDQFIGIVGCDASKGCNFIQPIELDCNVCKDGYFNYTRGQCLSCKNIKNCEKCHFDNELICDNCITGFTFNDQTKNCELYKCKEYEEVIPGCMVCKYSLDKDQGNQKCHICNIGYFERKDETCVYCRSDKYGGPGCSECRYDDEDNIICNYYDENRQNNSKLFDNGKLYDCKYELSESCSKCEFKSGELKCTKCILGYYLNSEGRCISFLDKIEVKPDCDMHTLEIGGISFEFESRFYDIRVESNEYNEYNLDVTLLESDIPNVIKTECKKCKTGFFLNDTKSCEILTADKCNGEFIFEDFQNREEECFNICREKGYPLIYFKLLNHKIIDFNINIDDNKEDLYDVISTYSFANETGKEVLAYIKSINLCYIFPDERTKKDFQGCSHVINIQNPSSYQCVQCKTGYILDSSTKKCHQYIEQTINYSLTNIGTESSPLYTTESCNDEEKQTLVTYGGGIKECIEDEKLANCIEAEADSSYIKPFYDCIHCSDNYISFCSRLYQRKICRKIGESVVEKNEISYEIYEKEKDFINTEQGKCKGENLFNPYKDKCFKCDNKNVGMLGCSGTCSFSLERSNMLLCESECKKEFIESSPGICEPCENLNEGCAECHYTTNYPSNYYGIKRKRRFQCDYCMEGYFLSQEGKCIKCSDVSLNNCEKCKLDDETGNIICSECSKHYFLNEAGDCKRCVLTKTLVNNKCIECDDRQQGGVDNCYYCKTNQEGDGLMCRECKEGYILSRDENKCLNRAESNLMEFESCSELIKQGSEYICSRCKPQFSLYKSTDGIKCIYTYLLDIKENIYNLIFSRLHFSDFVSAPCHETINLGKDEDPKYSCKRCYDIFEDDDLNDYYFQYEYKYDYYIYYYENYYNKEYVKSQERYYEYLPVKIYDEKIKASYCILFFTKYKNLDNCIEANLKQDGVEEGENEKVLTCTKCLDKAYSKYDDDLKAVYCSINKKTKGSCLVKFCKDCVNGNNYFCKSCFNDDYEVNAYTGSCVKKTKVVPVITWKDIFRLELNGGKTINGNPLFGPLFTLRGITCNEINSRHAFLVYVTFYIKHGLRNLEESKENISMEALCEIDQGVEETSEGVNIVDFECIGNTEEKLDDNYELSNINEIDANNGTIISGNMDEINSLIKIKDIKKTYSDYTLKDSDKIINFNVQSNETFPDNGTFYLEGIINKEIPKSKKKELLRSLSQDCYNNITIEMNVSLEKEECSFCVENETLTARLSCELEFKNDTNVSNIIIKNYELKIEDSYIYLSNMSNGILSFEKNNEPSIINNKSSSSNHTITIIVCVVVGIIVLGGITVLLVYILKKNKAKAMNVANNSKITEQQVNDSYKSDINLDKGE